VREGSYQRVAVDGTELAYLEQGSGAPLVYVHGALSDIRYLEAEVPVLAKRLRTIVYSRRYAWPNQPLGEGATDLLAQHVDDLAGVIRALDAAPAHVVGISLGGTIALLLAARHPDLVRTLILEDPGAFSILVSIPPKPQELLGLLLTRPRTFFMLMRVSASFGRIGAAMRQGRNEDAIRLMINFVNGFDAYSELPASNKEQAQANLATFRASLELPDSTGPTAADAQGIQQPLLLLTGDRSPAHFRMVIDRLAELMPNAEVKEIPGASHGMNFQNPEALDAAIIDFVERHA
jgi:pimeloyl-ACP methyl ester carboxylesterase